MTSPNIVQTFVNFDSSIGGADAGPIKPFTAEICPHSVFMLQQIKYPQVPVSEAITFSTASNQHLFGLIHIFKQIFLWHGRLAVEEGYVVCQW